MIRVVGLVLVLVASSMIFDAPANAGRKPPFTKRFCKAVCAEYFGAHCEEGNAPGYKRRRRQCVKRIVKECRREGGSVCIPAQSTTTTLPGTPPEEECIELGSFCEGHCVPGNLDTPPFTIDADLDLEENPHELDLSTASDDEDSPYGEAYLLLTATDADASTFDVTGGACSGDVCDEEDEEDYPRCTGTLVSDFQQCTLTGVLQCPRFCEGELQLNCSE